MEKVSRETAVQLGLKRYFTGVPCIHGHISERYVASNECVECNRLTQKGKKNATLSESDCGVDFPAEAESTRP